MSRDELIGLITRIYEAAADQNRWPVFLEKLAELFAARTTTLLLQNLQQPQGNVAFAVRTDPALVREYEEHYSKVTVWSTRGRHLMTQGNVVTGEMVCSASDVRRSEYSEYLGKLGVFHGYGAVIQRDNALASMLVSLRPARVGPFERNDVEILQILMPHLQQAVQIHRRLAGSQIVERGSLEALNRSALGIVLLDADGRIIFVNRTGEAILQRQDGLSIERGELRAANVSDTGALRGFLANAARQAEGASLRANGILAIGRPSLRAPYAVMATPFPALSAALPGLTTSAIAVFIRDPDAAWKIDEDILQTIYGLTGVEVRVATRLATGRSVDQIATEMGLTPGTTRWYLKRLFEKTGTRGQPDLVRVVLTSAAASADA